MATATKKPAAKKPAAPAKKAAPATKTKLSPQAAWPFPTSDKP